MKPNRQRSARDRAKARALVTRERDCTPRPVARQLLEATLDELDDLGLMPVGRPLEVLDGWAGAAPWSSELLQLCLLRGIDVRITAVEIDPVELVYMRRWCHVPVIADVFEVLEHWRGDLVIANPSFSVVPPDFRHRQPHRWPPESTPVPKIYAAARAGLLLHRVDLLSRGAGGQWLAEHYPPARVMSVAGSIGFRTGIDPERGRKWGDDQRSYAGHLWVRGHRGDWQGRVLPALPRADRRWVHRPGAEPRQVLRAMGLVEVRR